MSLAIIHRDALTPALALLPERLRSCEAQAHQY